MTPVSSIYETFTHLITKLKVNFPKLAYLHVTEPRVAGGGDQASEDSEDLEWIVSLTPLFPPPRLNSSEIIFRRLPVDHADLHFFSHFPFYCGNSTSSGAIGL